MSTLEKFLAGKISYEDAVTYLVRERSRYLHEATSAKGENPSETAKRRLFAYKQADLTHQQLKKVWFIRSTPPEFPESLNSHRLQRTYKGTATYRTPENFDENQISHTALTADEKFARENLELLNLDAKMARIVALTSMGRLGG